MNYLLYSLSVLLFLGANACRNNAQQAKPPVGVSNEDRQTMVEVNRLMVEKDDELIREYIAREALPMTRYGEGYYGMIAQEGSGPTAVDGTTLTLRATVRLLTGEICYQDRLITFVPGQTTAISGLHTVAKTLQKGTHARYIFPPLMAYGIYGDGDKIPQRSILDYDIEVLDVQPAGKDK